MWIEYLYIIAELLKQLRFLENLGLDKSSEKLEI